MSNTTLVVTKAHEGKPLSGVQADYARSRSTAPGEVRWRSEGTAFEVVCSDSMDPGELAASISSQFPGFNVDCNHVTTENRRKKLLVADMESTIIEQECLDELAEYVGLRDQVSDITERAMQGKLDFEAALRERVRLLRGLSVDLLEDLYRSKVTLMPGAEALVATMAANGAHCALVSGGFTWFTSRIAERLGFHSHQANELLIENGELTGEVGTPILGRAAKKAALERLCAERNITPADAICVGDGANDLDMLTRAGEAGGMGVAFHAKPIVAETAPHRIDAGDLTALLYLQGYNRDEITAEPSKT